MVLFSEMYASELIGDPVVDRLQEPIGKVKDILMFFGEIFPKVSGLLLTLENKREEAVLLIGEVDLIGKQFVVTKAVKEQVPFTKLREGETLLVRDLMDKQIVDVDGARVIRVNDLKLAKVDQEVRLIAVDVGMSGLLRRLSLDKIVNGILRIFGKRLSDSLIGWDHVDSFKTDISRGKITIPHKRTEELHPADIAQIISQVHTDEKAALFSSLSEKTAAEALHELEPMIGAMLLSALETKKALGILEKMPPDEAADLLGDISPEKTEEFLRLMKVKKVIEIKKLLKHHDETAGGLMTTEFISLPKHLTVEQAISRLREIGPSAETIFYVYVIDENEKLVGILSLRNLIVAAPHKHLQDIMTKNCITVTPEMNQRQVADIISKYNFLAMPVIDKEDKILGIVTVDDVVDFILPPISRRRRHMIG